MMSDGDMWLLVGVVALIATSGRRAVPWGSGWVWPVPPIRLDGATLQPVISQEYKATTHAGVDVMFKRAGAFFAPERTPIVAARAGRVWSVDKSPRGWEVVVDHGKPFATYYQHLSSVIVQPGDEVAAGAQLGTMGVDPLDGEHVRHLHFAVWFDGAGDAASVDPQVAMSSWAKAVPWDVPA